MFFDRIALERHDFSATKAGGPQKPLRQRPEFAVALNRRRQKPHSRCFLRQEVNPKETRLQVEEDLDNTQVSELGGKRWKRDDVAKGNACFLRGRRREQGDKGNFLKVE